jgi:hypothetical protein
MIGAIKLRNQRLYLAYQLLPRYGHLLNAQRYLLSHHAVHTGHVEKLCSKEHCCAVAKLRWRSTVEVDG